MYHSNKLKLTQRQVVDDQIGSGSLAVDNGNNYNDNDVSQMNDVDAIATLSAKKPHFLDYDAHPPQLQSVVSPNPPPPPDLIEHFDAALRLNQLDSVAVSELSSTDDDDGLRSSGNGEEVKMAKKYERDGEISDYELAAGGYTKKEFTQDDNTLQLDACTKKSCKHFLDENPIAPPSDTMLSKEKVSSNELASIVNANIADCGIAVDERRNSVRCSGVDDSVIHSPKCLDHQLNFGSCYTNFDLESDKFDALGQKVECIYSLLSMLGSNDPLKVGRKFHELSRNTDTCITLRRSGCIPLLIQMIYAEGGADEVRKWAGMALHNVIHSHPDEKAGRREAKVLRLLDQIMEYCNFLRTLLQSGGEAIADDADRHPLAAMSSLMKVSFDEEHRHAMCELGALHAIPNLVYLDHAAHGPNPESPCCNSLRRFALMALTNLTFGDEKNKALICSQKPFMEALVTQLDSTPDDLLQVTASVLRNLSWRADAQMKAVLNEIGTVTALANAAMKNKCENSLKAILSALWNLSAHCSTNKAEFCAVDGALSFIVKMLNYETLKIVENAGGILRNVSSHIAVREDYRKILREHNCLTILLQQLKSESLTVVSNSCGTLWNLSARCPQDQRFLWDNGAVPMLRSLINSKHAMIREGSACALKNLLNFRPSTHNATQVDPIARSLNLKKLPSLNVRKQKALEQELGITVRRTLTDTCDNLDRGMMKNRLAFNTTDVLNSTNGRPSRFPLSSPLGVIPVISGRLTRSAILSKSESRDSIFSAKSDTAVYDHLMRSHSAAETTRKFQHTTTSNITAFTLKNDVELSDGQPIDYAAKYAENVIKQGEHKVAVPPSIGETSYQETDLDQPTNFSLRYAESQADTYLEEADQVEHVKVAVSASTTVEEPTAPLRSEPDSSEPCEIILILEDSVKCYQTEDTPYIRSNAPSITDLRSNAECAKKEEDSQNIPCIENKKVNDKKCSKNYSQNGPCANTYGSRSYTPEKPVNYCEEGTPGYFSRYESLSSLDEAGQNHKKDVTASPPPQSDETNTVSNLPAINHENSEIKLCHGEVQANPTQAKINSALETPLMYSRHSSIDSLAEEDIEPIDDKSSVVSEFSRLASGIISPSEIPDSPTQNMPLSPCSNHDEVGLRRENTYFMVEPTTSSIQRSQSDDQQSESHRNTKHHYPRSIFEDDLNTFDVENTPAQFSTATSLSNLSILDDDSCSHPGIHIHKQKILKVNAIISENEKEEEEEDDGHAKSDDLLLATCINIGMNRIVDTKIHCNTKVEATASSINHEITQDVIKRYCTEDTPALLSKVGSNTNLSTISMYFIKNDNNNSDSHNEDKNNITTYNVPGPSFLKDGSDGITSQIQLTPSIRHSFNLSDDMSSNASESGVAVNNIDILQQCIRDGMQKSITKGTHHQNQPQRHHDHHNDPIENMRKGGNILPPYLINYEMNDEMNKYYTEDSPCNFSVTSGLSNLTVGSSLVGPAIKLCNNNTMEQSCNKVETNNTEVRLIQDDSLSSLSIESEDDNNLLNQTIAAGCNRSTSNMGFNAAIMSNGRNTIEPFPTTTRLTEETQQRRQPQLQSQLCLPLQQQKQLCQQYRRHADKDDSDSSIHSSDSNDNHSKSLFELCILTGMHKTLDSGGSKAANNLIERHKLHKKKTGQGNESSSSQRGKQHNTTRSNPNLKQNDSLWIDDKYKRTNRHLLEQEKRDEKLLLECINTGIMKKINESPRTKLKERQQQLEQQQMELLLNNDNIITETLSSLPVTSALTNGQPKNGQATSVAVQKQMKKTIHPHKSSFITMDANIIPNAIVSVTIASISNISTNTVITTTTTTIPIITAAPDVEKNNKNSNIITMRNAQYSMISNHQTKSHNYDQKQLNTINSNVPSINHHHEGIVEDQKKSLSPSPSILTVPKQKMSGPENSQHEVLIMTDNVINAVSTAFSNTKHIDNTELRNIVMDKHKDPDLMLKSVERLTMEFVSSAEQLRINSLSGHQDVGDASAVAVAHDYDRNTNSNGDSSNINPRRNLLYNKHMMLVRKGFFESSTSATNSTNTWNDDEDNTYPNNVSFPSVSIAAPKVASTLSSSSSLFTQNKTDNNMEDDQATTADDYKEKCCRDSKASLSQKEQITVDTAKITGKDNEKSNSLNDKAIFSNNSTNGINFQLGGEVKTAAAATSSSFHSNNNNKINNDDNCLINSIFIGQEAEKLAANFQMFHLHNETDSNHNNCSYEDDDNGEGETEMMVFSMNSIDLDNIRPPSGMNSLNISGYYQDVTLNAGSGIGVGDVNDMFIMNSSQKLTRNYISNQQQQQHLQLCSKSPKLHKKQLPIGLVARRAVGHLPLHLSGSTDSVLSSCNIMLDNIKPPSLMDELLDSMVSVASIQSEMIDDCTNLPTTITPALSNVSNYETSNANANGNYQTTITPLENCQLTDDCTLNDTTTLSLPLDYDYSSAESTGQKSFNMDSLKSGESLTSKQKRKLVKDRFKTYTIKSNGQGQGQCQGHENDVKNGDIQSSYMENVMHSQDDEPLSIETLDHNNVSDTYQTESEVSNTEGALKTNNKSKIITRRRSSQDRYKTQTIIFPSSIISQKQNYNNALNMAVETDGCDDDGNISLVALDRKFESDLSSLDCLQNSETESSHDLNINSLPNDDAKIKNKYFAEPATTIVKRQLKLFTKTVEGTQNVPYEKVNVEEPKKRSQYTSTYSKYQRNISQPNQINGSFNKSSNLMKGSVTKANININSNNNCRMKSIAPNTTKANTRKIIATQNKGKTAKENIVNGTVSENRTTYVIKRQSTFTKEKPEITDANAIPIVKTSPIHSRCPSKLPTKQLQTTTNSTKTNNVNFTNKQNKTTTQTQKATTRNIIKKRPTAAISNHQIKPQRANSNVTMRTKVSAHRNQVLSKRISTTTLPSRSNSTVDNTPTTTPTALVNSVSTAAPTAVGGKIAPTQSRIVANHRLYINRSPKNPIKLSINNNRSNNAIASSTITGHIKRSRTFNSTEVFKTPTTTTNTNPTTISKLTTTTKNIRVASTSNFQNTKSVMDTKWKNYIKK